MSFGAAADPHVTCEIAKATVEEFRSMCMNHARSPMCDVLRYQGRKNILLKDEGQVVLAISFKPQKIATAMYAICGRKEGNALPLQQFRICNMNF